VDGHVEREADDASLLGLPRRFLRRLQGLVVGLDLDGQLDRNEGVAPVFPSLHVAETGDFDTARAAYREGLSLFDEARDLSGIALLLDDLSDLALTEGDVPRAARLAGGAAALQRQSGTGLADVLHKAEGRSRPGEKTVDEHTIRTAWNDGQTLPLDRLIAYALGRDA